MGGCPETQGPVNLADTIADKRPSHNTNKVEDFTQAAHAYTGTQARVRARTHTRACAHTHIYTLPYISNL